jgi:NAD+ synthase
MKIAEELELPWETVEHRIEEGIKSYMNDRNFDRAFIGVSGGIDSTVVAYLTSRAIDPERTISVTMNDTVTPYQDKIDAERIAKELGIKQLNVDITSVTNNFTDQLNEELFVKFSQESLKKIINEKGRNAYSNIKPRTRMTILYFFANMLNGSVIGTSNRSELLLGFFTKYGDGAADVLPIGDLYKTQVKALGEYLGVPANILMKKPSPGLIQDQTAESELGFTYDEADLVLYYGIDRNFSRDEIAKKLNLDGDFVDRILAKVKSNEHKREMPPIIKIR